MLTPLKFGMVGGYVPSTFDFANNVAWRLQRYGVTDSSLSATLQCDARRNLLIWRGAFCGVLIDGRFLLAFGVTLWLLSPVARRRGVVPQGEWCAKMIQGLLALYGKSGKETTHSELYFGSIKLHIFRALSEFFPTLRLAYD